MKNQIIPISAFKDNYIWLLWDEQSHSAAVVDPGDANPVISFLQKHSLRLTDIFITHHHADHSGGVADLLSYQPNINVYGSHKSSVPTISRHVREGDIIKSSLKVLEIPGHTLDHIAFYNDEILFCGDTLFSAGCGRVFEGTYEQMYDSLKKLSSLPKNIKIYCGHEYTLANLKFAQQVEPQNPVVAEKIERVKMQSCTLPSTLKEELMINPFLRCEEREVIAAAENQAGKTLATPEQVFQCLREWKNAMS